MDIGAVETCCESRLGREVSLEQFRTDYGAVLLGIGLASVSALPLEGEVQDQVHDAVDFIASLMQAAQKAYIPVGRDVVVIDGGMPAVYAAVRSKLLGAEHVTMVYRGSLERMSAS